MTGKLFYLDPGAKTINAVHTDGSNRQVLVRGREHVPDGIVVDVKHGHIYWTEMGEMEGDQDDGSVRRANLDGSDLTTIVPVGGTHTPKQLTISVESKRLWWCDREGMRIMTCSLDGSDLRTLIDRRPRDSTFDVASKDERNHCVGIAVDEHARHVYWSQKGPPKGGQGRIFRSTLDGAGDVETLLDALPEPIDLALVRDEADNDTTYLYWTDRGAPPQGNTVNRCILGKGGAVVLGHVQILAGGFHETIGLSVVTRGPDAGHMYVTDLAGTIYRAKLDGSEKTVVLAGGEGDQLTGIWYADV